MGLGYDDLGKRRNGRPSTLKFCDELRRLFGHDDGQVAAGASFAVENWAAAGFWQELEDGLMQIKQDRLPTLRLAFFTWHNRVEAQHASHVMEEVEEAYFDPEFSRERFFQGAAKSWKPSPCSGTAWRRTGSRASRDEGGTGRGGDVVP